MRRQRAKTVQTFIEDDLKKQINKLMDNRRRLLAPFPVAAEEIYRACWTREELAAMDVLSRKGIFKTDIRLMIEEFPVEDRMVTIDITLPERRPMPYYMRIDWEKLPTELTRSIANWAPQWLQLRAEQDDMLKKINQLSQHCKTYGQLYRLWPDILSLFDSTGREKINAAKAASRLPDTVYEWEVDAKGVMRPIRLREEFSPSAFAPFTSMIAECLMLPENNDREVATIS